MMQMMKFSLLLLVTVILVSGCSALPGQPPVALALENPGRPFQAGVEIAKPTYTPTPTATLSPTPLPPTAIPSPLPTESPTAAVFAEDAFVVIENLSAPADSAGYDNTTQYDAPSTYNGSKYILVDISEQHMYVYDGDTLLYSFIASTGMGNSTRVGTFSVLNKIPNAYGATWNIWMPNWLGIYWSGSLQNGIHALPILSNGATLWAGYLGTPISYGCIVLNTYDAQVLYDWADIGTPVEIRW
jgi:lipoprotein-anchoring transpeptidase ErfK/SrfK